MEIPNIGYLKKSSTVGSFNMARSTWPFNKCGRESPDNNARLITRIIEFTGDSRV